MVQPQHWRLKLLQWMTRDGFHRLVSAAFTCDVPRLNLSISGHHMWTLHSQACEIRLVSSTATSASERHSTVMCMLNASNHQQASSSLTQLLADWQCECQYAVELGHLVAVTSNAHQKVVWLHITMNEAFAVYKLNTTNHLQQRHRQIINSSAVTLQLSLSVQWHQFDISELTRHARM